MATACQLNHVHKGAFKLSGALTFATVNQVLKNLYQVVDNKILEELDLSALEQVDSAGVACILATMARAEERQMDIRLSHPPENLVHLAEVCDLQTILGI